MGLDYLLPEEVKKLEDIENKKTDLLRKVTGYQNQHRVFRMILARAKLAAQHLKETKPLCGYDDRLTFNEAEFERWSQTTEGKTALETGVLGPRTDETKHIGAHVPFPGQVIPEPPVVPDVLNNMCLSLEKSKCKHNKLGNWKEIHSMNIGWNLSLANDQINKLAIQEAEIYDDAETREATKGYYEDNKTTQLF
jgi:COMPASS component SPP1